MENVKKESDIEEEIRKVKKLEEDMNEKKESLKEKEERVKMENMKKESEIEEVKEVIVDEKYMDIRSPKYMLIASSVKKSVVSRE